MSAWDMCACLFQQFARQFESVEGILNRVNGQTVIHANGQSAHSVLSPLTSNGQSATAADISPVALVTMTFVVLFVIGLLLHRPRPKETAPPTGKHTPPSNGPPDIDRNLLD